MPLFEIRQGHSSGYTISEWIIEFDICLTEQVSFSGFFFRQTSPGNYEEFLFPGAQSATRMLINILPFLMAIRPGNYIMTSLMGK
jgi:hypothetical protein